MANTQALIAQAYSAFNRRDVEGALAVMTENVDWPKASEGGRVVGKEEIRAYWTRQWAEFNPNVEPIEVTDREAGRTDVKVHQLVKNLNGDIIKIKRWCMSSPSQTALSNAWIWARENLLLAMIRQVSLAPSVS